MAEQNVFNKIHVDERDKADLGGVLEQLNLPPAAVTFVRKNQKTIYIVLGLIAILVVAWSLYGSYIDNKIAKSNSALAAAVKLEGSDQIAALKTVIDEFSGTDSATWAKVELARSFQKNKAYDKALQYYTEIRQPLKTTNPLYYLATFSIAQMQEVLGNLESALEEYATLKNATGYESVGYSGTARIYEMQDKKNLAIAEYEQYLGIFEEGAANNGEKAYITEKLSRLKASL